MALLPALLLYSMNATNPTPAAMIHYDKIWQDSSSLLPQTLHIDSLVQHTPPAIGTNGDDPWKERFLELTNMKMKYRSNDNVEYLGIGDDISKILEEGPNPFRDDIYRAWDVDEFFSMELLKASGMDGSELTKDNDGIYLMDWRSQMIDSQKEGRAFYDGLYGNKPGSVLIDAYNDLFEKKAKYMGEIRYQSDFIRIWEAIWESIEDIPGEIGIGISNGPVFEMDGANHSLKLDARGIFVYIEHPQAGEIFEGISDRLKP